VTVPYGTFDSIRLEFTFSLTGVVNGTTVNETATSIFWLAPQIGIVRDDEEQFGVLELLSTNIQTPEPGPTPTPELDLIWLFQMLLDE
jgi:hypothetical protein